jgi:hypothetical protein
MLHAQLTDEVRRQVMQTFGTLGVANPAEMRESILIRDGNYCGRRFEADSAAAVWFVEENELKFYRPDGSVQTVVAPRTGERAMTRMAA